MGKKYNSYLNNFNRRENFKNYIENEFNFFKTAAPLIILCVGIYLVTKNTLSIGGAVALYSLSGTLFSLSSSILDAWNNYILIETYLERIEDIESVKKEDQPNNIENLELAGDIKLKNISFSYSKNSQPVIDNISLHIKSGQKVAIVGKSGSGKSTLAKILVGLYTPTKGEMYYDNININRLNKKLLRKQIGIVPQDVSLFSKSIYENISMNRLGVSLENVKNAAEIACIANEIEEMPMKYETVISEMGMNLSGGQRQRIVLARAIVNKPKILILDEATSSLDNINEYNVSEYFKSIGCTRIIIAHRLSTIIDADIIFVMGNGKIIENGDHISLIRKRGEYFSLYHSMNNNSDIENSVV